MARRTNHPLKSLALFAMIGVLGWLAYEFIHVRKVLSSEPDVLVPVEILEKVRGEIIRNFDSNPCVIEFDNPTFRSRANHYRINVTLADGCDEKARAICKDIGRIVAEVVDDNVGVFAWDQAGNLITKYLD